MLYRFFIKNLGQIYNQIIKVRGYYKVLMIGIRMFFFINLLYGLIYIQLRIFNSSMKIAHIIINYEYH